MAFIHMICRGFHAQGPECTDAANAKDNLLSEPHVPVPAIEPRGNIAMFGRIFLYVGVEQVKGNPSYHETPYLDFNRFAAYEDFHHDRLAIFVSHKAGRHRGNIVFRIGFLLPAVGIQVLLKIAFMVKKANTNHGKIEIAGRLQVVPCKDAQASGIDGQALGQTEFR